MTRKLFLSVALISALFLTMPLAAQAVPVDTQLMLVIDVSGSISSSEYNLMMDGYANAFRSTAVKNAIYGNDPGQYYNQIVVGLVFFDTTAGTAGVGWNLLSNETSVNNFANLMDNLARPLNDGSTNIAAGIDLGYSLGVASANTYEPTTKIMDVSGDGTQNTGSGNLLTLLHNARDQALTYYDVINGITVGDSSLQTYYTSNVIGGTDAFAEHATNFAAFQGAIQDKLVREIGGDTVPEPGTLLLFGSAAGVLGFWRRRRNKKA